MTEAKRAAIYLRISKKPNGEEDAEASHSVEDQRVRCEALTEASGYQVVAVFTDDGISAYRSKKDRPGYGDLKAALSAGAFDVLVFDRQDRLARDQTETLEFVAACRRAGIEWHSVREGHIDLSEPMQVLFAIFRGGEAESYSTKINQNSRVRNQTKREKGLPGAGQRPFGWTKAERATGYVQDLVGDEADLVRKGTDMILSGASTYQVMRLFNDSGVKTVRGNGWYAANVGALLRRWRNAGWVEHDDQPHTEAIWPAIVSLEDVRNVRTILDGGRIPGRWRTPTMLCSGIARCHCGLTLMVTGDEEPGKPAYRCSGIVNGRAKPGMTHVTIRAALLDPRVRDEVIDAYFSRPASSNAGRGEAASLARVYERQATLRADRAKIQSLARAGVYDEAEAAREIAAVDASISESEAEARTLAASSAHAAMLAESMNTLVRDLDLTAEITSDNATLGLMQAQASIRAGKSAGEAMDAVTAGQWWDLDEHGEPVWRVDPEVHKAVAARFDSLDLEHRRDLMRSLVTVKVMPGRGAKRAVIRPVKVGAASA